MRGMNLMSKELTEQNLQEFVKQNLFEYVEDFVTNLSKEFDIKKEDITKWKPMQ